MKSNYAELQRRNAINFGDTECKYKLYVDYAKEQKTTATETIIEDDEVEESERISIIPFLCLAWFIYFCWDKGLVYIRV